MRKLFTAEKILPSNLNAFYWLFARVAQTDVPGSRLLAIVHTADSTRGRVNSSGIAKLPSWARILPIGGIYFGWDAAAAEGISSLTTSVFPFVASGLLVNTSAVKSNNFFFSFI